MDSAERLIVVLAFGLGLVIGAWLLSEEPESMVVSVPSVSASLYESIQVDAQGRVLCSP